MHKFFFILHTFCMKGKIISLFCLSVITSAACALCACHNGQTGSGETLKADRDFKITTNDGGGATLPDCPDDDCPDGNRPDNDCPKDNCPEEQCPDGKCPEGEKQPGNRRHRRGKKRASDGTAPEFKPFKSVPRPTPLPAPDNSQNK